VHTYITARPRQSSQRPRRHHYLVSTRHRLFCPLENEGFAVCKLDSNMSSWTWGRRPTEKNGGRKTAISLQTMSPGKVGTSAISDRGCISLGSLTMKPRDRTQRFPNIGLITQSNTHTPATPWPAFIIALVVPSLNTPLHPRCLPPPPLAKEYSSVGRALAPHRLAPRWLHT